MRLATLLAVLALLLSASAAAQTTVTPTSVSPFDVCRSGKVRGGPVDSDTGLRSWACGNYNWSAEVGGTTTGGNGEVISDYDTATTEGGNSWQTTCISDGQGTPDTVEETPCLHAGEVLNNYATANIVLAADNVRNGGKIYLPAGLYVLAYCGQDADGNGNGCPVLQHGNDHYQRRVDMWGGRELIGEGQDPDGPHANGRTGTWLISAEGDDLDDDGDLNDDICDRNGDGWCPTSNGTLKAGGSMGAYACKRDNDTGGCAVSTAATGNDRINVAGYARTFTDGILSYDIDVGGVLYAKLCVEDTDMTNTGTCAGTTNQISGAAIGAIRPLQCTTTSGGRLSTTTGDCVIDGTDYGPCETIYDALWTDMQAQEATNTTQPTIRLSLQASPSQHMGLGSELIGDSTQRALARIGAFDNAGNITGATPVACGNGKYLHISSVGAPNRAMHPFAQPIWDASVQARHFTIPDWGKFNNTEGGYSYLNIMPAHWLGRDSPNNAADCNTFGAGGTQDDGNPNSACDSVGLIHMGAGWKGHFRHITTWYGGGEGYALSLVDGNASGFYTELGWSSLNSGAGLGSDASGWWFHDNEWRDWKNASGNFMGFNYGPGFVMERNKFWNLDYSTGFKNKNNPGAVLRDNQINSSFFGTGMFTFVGAQKMLISGLTGFGNRGTVFLISPEPDEDSWDVTVENVDLAAHGIISGGSKPEALIVRFDGDGDGAWSGGNINNFVFRNHHYSVSGTEDVCMAFLEGGKGDESAAEHGLGRTVDDDRHQLSFENISIERVAESTVTGDVEFFCLGNATALEQSPSEAMALVPGGIFDSRGGMPRWAGLSIDGMFYPDNPYRSVRAVDAVLDSTSDVDSNQITFTDHGLRDRDAVTLTTVTGDPPTNLVTATVYYVIYVDKDTISLDDDRSVAAALTIGDETGTFTLTTGFEPDADELPQGTPARTHSATAEGACTDADTDGLLDGGGDFNALCKVNDSAAWVDF